MDSSGTDRADVTGGSAPNLPLHPGDRPPRAFLHGLEGLERGASTRTRHRIGLALGFGAAVVGTVAAIDIGRELGLAIPVVAWGGLFLANWVGNGGILVPIPGLRFIGWTMAVHQGAEGEAIIVGLIAGLAMALGQTSYYLSASAGSRRIHTHAASETAASDGAQRARQVMQRARATIERLLRDYGVPTIFSLSALPNPFTTFASITAGSIGMGFRRFLAANFAGHVVLGLILALFGTWLIGE